MCDDSIIIEQLAVKSSSPDVQCDNSLLNQNVCTSKLDESELIENLQPKSKLSLTLNESEEEQLKMRRINKNNRMQPRISSSLDLTLEDEFVDTVVDLTLEEKGSHNAKQIIQDLDTDTNDVIEQIETTAIIYTTETVDTEEYKVALDDTSPMITEQIAENSGSKSPCNESINENVDETLLLVDQERNYFQRNILELGRRLWLSDVDAQHYTKGCLWSPDGTCVLVPIHLDGMHVIELPQDLYDSSAINDQRALSPMHSAVHVKEGGTVYDCAWFPHMNSCDPNTCIWLATRQHEPIHMWDAFNGELRCSYRGYDDVDEVETAISITFSYDGQKIYGGYKKNIKIFDTNVPGRDYSSIRVKQAISCLAMTTDSSDTITTGSWTGYINHYDLRAPKLGSLFTLGGHSGGITWLSYAPTSDNWLLFSGARKDNKILQWDMRNYVEPIYEFQRNVATNQRIYFDLSPQMQWLASGDTEGKLRIWDLLGEKDSIEIPLHNDCCNGVNFHPTLPILATSSGQYHFIDEPQENGKSDENLEKIINYENSLLLLWYGNR